MTVTDAPSTTRSTALPAAAGRSTLLGWLAVGLLTAVVWVTWLPLSAPFGDDHDGRTLVLNAIQVEQVRERGLLDTDLGSSLAPYVEARSYAHHPPAMKVPYLAASYLPVSLETSTRLVSYALGLLTLPALALLLRRLGVGWAGTVAGVAVVAALPMFWAYGRIHGPLGATVLLAAVVADLRTRDEVSTPRLVGACLLAAFVVASNWYALAAAGLLGLWLLAGRRRLDRVVVAMGATMALAAAVTIGWVVGVAGTEEMLGSIDERAAADAISRADWWQRMQRWVDELVPVWWQLLAAAAVVGGVVVRRTRVPVLVSLALGIGWVALLPGGSFVHDYWLLPLALPVGLGLAGLLAAGADRLSDAADGGLALVAGALGVVAVLGLSGGAFGAAYETEPRDLPRVAAELGPAPGQATAWHSTTISGRLTVAWAWDLPSAPLDDLALRTAPDTDRVLVDLERPPRFLPAGAPLAASTLAVEGDYGVVTVAELRRLAAAS